MWSVGVTGPPVAGLQAGVPLLPEGFALPPPVYLFPVLATTAGVVILLVFFRPTVTDWTAMALSPWIATGATLHVLYQQPAFFDVVRPLFGTPMVYLTMLSATGAVWIASEVLTQMTPSESVSVDRAIASAGTGVLLSMVYFSLSIGGAFGSIAPLWPVIGITITAFGTIAIWFMYATLSPSSARTVYRTGGVVIFGHLLDGVSTAFGIDVLGVQERSPLAKAILNFSASLPTAEVFGVGWLFVMVKISLSLLILYGFTDYLEERPDAARLVLIGVAAVGLGPGFHNVVLFTVRESIAAAAGA